MAERRYCLCAIRGFFFLLLLLLFLFSFVDVPLASAATLNKTQDAILRDIENLVNTRYASTWWNTADSNPCLWTGVDCSSSGSSVIGITLSNYGISSSSIFSSLCRLDSLQHLDLSRNYLTDLNTQLFPPSCSLNEGLLFLNLNNNMLSHPLSDSPDFPLLQVLDLSFNYLSSGNLSAELGSFRSLKSLNLSSNNISGCISSDLGYLSELEILDLSHNILSCEVPSSLERLQSLTTLVLSYNNLSGSVPSFSQNVEIGIDGNPDLVHGTRIHNGVRSYTVLLVILAVIGGLVALCFLLVIAKISFPKRIYRAEDETIPTDEEGASQMINCCLITMCCICIRTKATMLMKEKLEDWRITAFQTLNFEAEDILQGLTWANLVGSGGSGHVYRVTYTNRYNNCTGVVAVKQIQSAGALDEKLELEFESETSILCNIRHNNIVRLLCCLSSMESKLLVYDYMDNGSLDRWLHGDYVLRAEHATVKARPVQRVPLDWPTRIIAAVGAAQGLCYMHHNCSPPIIHRDVKTSNILLDSEFRAKVADFGLARMLVQTGEPNTMTWVVGSFGYMAPEYAYTRKVTEKVDVFGFGVVLLELTTGKKANDGGDHGSLSEWAEQHYRSGASIPDATDISIRYAGYSDEIDTVFRLGVKCTGKSPSSRPTMEDVLQILLKCSDQTLRKSRLECIME